MQLSMLIATVGCMLLALLAGSFVQANNYNSNDNQQNTPVSNNYNNNYGNQPSTNNQVQYHPNQGPNSECRGAHCNGANPAREYHSHPAVRPTIYGGRGLYNYQGYARNQPAPTGGYNSNRSYKQTAPLALRPISVIAVQHPKASAPRYPSGHVRPQGPPSKQLHARYPKRNHKQGGRKPVRGPRRHPHRPLRLVQRPRLHYGGHQAAPRHPVSHKPRGQRQHHQQRGYSAKPTRGHNNNNNNYKAAGHSKAKKPAAAAATGGY